MARFRIGQKIKKVRGHGDIDKTGVFCAYVASPTCAGYDCLVEMDMPCRDSNGSLHPSQTIGWTIEADWDPLICGDTHIAADDETTIADILRCADAVAKERA